ncbi:MAG: MarR family winged helix-turn-helix transcriptional regulator [Corynebacterium sp.]|uniref:MarR family winged helix-turn-helix transcriptional regulator n=1 Tax=Corynebacterium sp. TaxID=1720 RepID=UPI003F0F5B63
MKSERAVDYVDHIVDQWGVVDPDLDVSPLEVFGRLHRTYLLYSHIISETFEEYGINQAGFDVLASLKRAGKGASLTPSQLSEQALVTSGGVSLRLNRLEDAGLVERIRGRKDRRAVSVRLTESGEELIARVSRRHFAREAELLEGLDSVDRQQLAELLRKLFVSLDSDGEEQSG